MSESRSTIPSLFCQRVERTPDAIALVENDVAVSYRELNRRANLVAHALLKAGVGHDDLVAICVPRSIAMITATLGILKTGAAYLPMDVSWPRERVRSLLECAGAKVVVNKSSTSDLTREVNIHTVTLDLHAQDVERQRNWNPKVEEAERDTCCVLFTSGTSGRSCGVLVTHEAALSRFTWMWHAYPIASSDVALIHRSSVVIGSLWDCFGALIGGAPSIVLPGTGGCDPGTLWKTLNKYQVTRMSASPSVWTAVVERAECESAKCESLRLGISAGEVLAWDLVSRVRGVFPKARFLNVYGTTECNTPMACDVTDLTPDQGSVPTGPAVPGTEILLLGESMEPVNVGEVGEIYVGGSCLARGYLKEPTLTAQRFVQSVTQDRPSARLFRTGDLARQRPDGTFEIMGRRDQQVKVHGFRVDTLEVERALLAYRGVRAVAVSPYRRENGSVWLVAWMVSERPGEDWRGLLRWRLPNHMIPAMFVEVESLPMTFSGKVDRQALVDSTRLLLRGNPESAAPVSETSRIVEVLVGEILEIDHVDMSMPFEMIGGYSLAAARLIIRIKHAFGVDVEADELFSDISLETLAARIDSRMESAK